MNDRSNSFRLDGLEPDNLLAFLALLGLLRALETVDSRSGDPRWLPRASWDLTQPPLRPRLHLRTAAVPEDIARAAAMGVRNLARTHDFGGRADLNHTAAEAVALLVDAAQRASRDERDHADLLTALMSDIAVKDAKKDVIEATPLCFQFGQGHQHFLDRLANVPGQESVTRSRTEADETLAGRDVLEALFEPWHRSDSTFSFRWDPEEDVRYALMAGDPTAAAYKAGTQHGANRLAAVGLAALTAAPRTRRARIRLDVAGGRFDRDGFAFAWPVWSDPASFTAIRAMLTHPSLHTPGGLAHLGVDHVMVARRISVGKYMNVGRARPLA